ncbi:DUF3810 domain-containing protein [Oscillibacter sp.]|uniref:DUF3810 domain-containing protein n=1 Tax=Oscillibacter sp. TaxID=1945593 RepID=UPI0028981029|nr:DUF3810 domain-containing protein [Oscillibacter sp.]
MKPFFLRYKKLHLWLGADLLLLVVFFAVRWNGAWMTALTERVTNPFRRLLGSFSYRVDFSVMEVLCGLLVVFVAAYLSLGTIAVLRKKEGRGHRAYGALLGAVCTGLTVWLAFCWLWGVQYRADGFQAKSGIVAEDVSLEDLTAVTQYFADRLAETSGQVPRDENGLFSLSTKEILKESVWVYDRVSKEFPFLYFDDAPPKAVYFSRVMSMLDFTGFYCPLVGESNVNVDSPAVFLPSTVAHELAHQRGFASEQECNFIAVLACTVSGLPEYAYSGWLLGYVHLGNALYQADPDRWRVVYEGLPDTVRADLAYNNAYWAQFRDSTVKKVSNKVYDGLLKGYGDENGMKSYGMVVDLLTAYYKEPAA